MFLFLNSLQTGCNQFLRSVLRSFRHPLREGPAEINQHEIWLLYFSMHLLCPAGQPSNKTDSAPPGCLLYLPCPALPCPALPCPALPCPALPCIFTTGSDDSSHLVSQPPSLSRCPPQCLWADLHFLDSAAK